MSSKLALPNLAYSLGAAVVLADQLSKYWILNVLDLPEKRQIHVLPFFDLSSVSNPGVSFGLFGTGGEIGRWVLSAFSAGVVIALAIWVRKARRPLTAVSIGLIIGGAVGNLIDRVTWGHVTDFLDFSRLGFRYVFNVADSAINIGIALLLIETFLIPERTQPTT